MSFVFAEWDPVVPEEGAVTVKEVRAYVIGDKKLEETSGGGADCHAQSHGHWIVDTPIANPMSIYEHTNVRKLDSVAMCTYSSKYTSKTVI